MTLSLLISPVRPPPAVVWMAEEDSSNAETVERKENKSNFVAPFLIFFAFGLVVAGICAFVNVVTVNALVRRRMAYMPRPQKVKIKKGKKRKSGGSRTEQMSSKKSSRKSKSGSKKSTRTKSKTATADLD